MIRGVIRTESFSIPPEEVDALAETIAGAAADILALSFWNTRCDDAECAWCAIRFDANV